MRKQLLTSAAALALSVGAAFASDLPTHKAPPPPPAPAAFSWTGFYVGVQAGYGWGAESDDFSYVPRVLDSFDVSGPIGGAHIGYDQQFDTLVIGVVADIDASGIEGGKSSTFNGTYNEGVGVTSLSMRNTWQASLRARAGVAFDRLLIYGTGGVAFADDKETAAVNDPNFFAWSGSQTNTLVGWTIGAGAEYAFDRHWSASAELRYADFGKGSYSGSSNHFVLDYSAGFDETLAQVGLSYRF
jgi:outer membrane immunogenic protein